MGTNSKYGESVGFHKEEKMKKFLVLFIVLFTVFPVFAQDDDQADTWKGKRMAITLNPNTIILGIMSEGIGFSAGFEYAFVRHFTTKLNLYVVAFRPDSIYSGAIYVEDDVGVSYRFSLDARWFPLGGAVEGLFANVGFQYQQTLGNFYIEEQFYNSDTEWNEYIFTKFKGDIALGGYFGVGYKVVLGRGRVAFVIEPCMDVIWSYHLGKRPTYGGNWMLGQNGYRVTTNFGFAF
jgi:hypothetical protein